MNHFMDYILFLDAFEFTSKTDKCDPRNLGKEEGCKWVLNTIRKCSLKDNKATCTYSCPINFISVVKNNIKQKGCVRENKTMNFGKIHIKY